MPEGRSKSSHQTNPLLKTKHHSHPRLAPNSAGVAIAILRYVQLLSFPQDRAFLKVDFVLEKTVPKIRNMP